jgi:enoyl-CoA hydratase
MDVIDECFSAPSVEEIVARLDAVGGSAQAWAQAVVADLRRRSPVSLKIAHRHIRQARERDLRETLHVDYRLACRLLAAHDFCEGVRAALIDKDGNPSWVPARLEDVTPEIVDAYFAPLGADELRLETRAEMQELRA